MKIDGQDLNLIKEIKTNENWIDLDYLGYSSVGSKDDNNTFEKKNEKAHINRVLFWLSSKKGDFGREDINKGGLLYELLGNLSRDTDLIAWENVIRDQFNAEFSGDLSLIGLHLSVDKFYKKLTINMLVQDLMTKIPFKVYTGVEK